MKKSIFSVFVVLCLFFSICVQESSADESPVVFPDVPKVIVHQEGFLNFDKFEFLDGTKIKRSDLNDVLRTAPENERFVKKASFWNGVGIAGSIAFIGGLAGACLIENDYAALACSAVSLAGAVSIVFSFRGIYYKARAVDNYNLYALGLERAE